PSVPAPDRSLVHLEEEVEKQDARVLECGAPCRAEQRVGEVAALGGREQVDCYEHVSHLGLWSVVMCPLRPREGRAMKLAPRSSVQGTRRGRGGVVVEPPARGDVRVRVPRLSLWRAFTSALLTLVRVRPPVIS